MADVLTDLVTENGDRVVLKGTSLAPATQLGKGAVKQGYGVAKDPYQSDIADKKINTILDSLRQSGVINNDKFVVFYDGNFPEGKDGGYIPVDLNVYTAGQSAIVKFWTSDDDTPYCEGHTFIGWATSPSASVPTYPANLDATQTVTFVDDDITLYAVWEAATVTITYSLGVNGTGSVPSPQTVTEGAETELSFLPTPTVNDGSGRVFVGWSYEDAATSYTAADFRQDGTTHIYPYSDVTLYPVFCYQYTLTYALGNDATGSVPSSQTGFDGETLYVDFMTHPTCLSDPSRNWIGWSETDESSSPTYNPSMGTNSIYMSGNVTLYPVFEAAQVTYTCTYMNGMYSTGSVPSSSTGVLSGSGESVVYTLDFSTYPTCTRAGTWNFIGWSTIDGQTSNPTYPASGWSSIGVSPVANLTLYPVFEEQQSGGGAGTIEVVNNSAKGYDISVYDQTDKTTVLTVSANTTDSFTFDTSHSYEFQTSMTNATFNGTYNGQPYSTKGLSYGNSTLNNPYDSKSNWVFISGDGGTVTVS